MDRGFERCNSVVSSWHSFCCELLDNLSSVGKLYTDDKLIYVRPKCGKLLVIGTWILCVSATASICVLILNLPALCRILTLRMA